MVNGKAIPLHFMGYIALPISLIWLVLIFVAMGFVFPCLLKLLERVPPNATKLIASTLGAIMAVDFIATCIVLVI
jgi:uncharacterized membrane protein